MTDANDASLDAGRADASCAGLRRYRSPELIEYGSIAKLTQGSKSTMGDGMGGGFKMASMMMMMCL